MGDHVEIMLRKVMAAMMTNDRALVDQVSQMDNSVDSLDEAIKLYVTKLTRGSLDEREGQRAMEIVSFAINLEHIGDIIDKNLSELATKKIKRRFQFSAEGAEELSAFHKRTMDSLRIAFGVFMSGDVNEARELLARRPRCVMPNWPRPSGISTACARDVPKPSRPPRSISTFCATSDAFTRTSARWPTRCWTRPANSPPIGAALKVIWPRSRRRYPAAPDQRSSVFDALPRCLTISMMFLI